MAEPNQQSVSIDEIPIEQLGQIKRQIDEECDVLTNSFTTLKQAETKFRSAMNCLGSLKKDKQMLVPLTASLYVPGSLSDAENVLVDVGTGYFVEKSIKEAKTYYNTRLLDLRRDIDRVKAAMDTKEGNRTLIAQALQRRAASQAAQRKAVRAA